MGINIKMVPKFNKDDLFNTITVLIFFICVVGGAFLLEKDIGKSLSVRYEVKADGKQYVLYNLIIYSDGITGNTDEGERVVLKDVKNLSYSPVKDKLEKDRPSRRLRSEAGSTSRAFKLNISGNLPELRERQTPPPS